MAERHVETVIGFAENPQSCFDRFLALNKDKISQLSTKQLLFMITARERCLKAEAIVPFTFQELGESVEEGLVSPNGILAEVYNNYLIAESFFE